MKVKRGQPIDLNVSVDGCPAPTVEWFINGKPVTPTNEEDEEVDDVMTSTTNKEAQMGIKRADKKHRGKLKMVVKNEHGTTEAEVNVLVYGKQASWMPFPPNLIDNSEI